MARYTGPGCKLSRREGTDLLRKSRVRSLEDKCRHDRVPGARSTQRPGRISDYGLQLREKQKARYMYGIMEAQFRRYVDKAFRQAESTGQNLIRQLETRLDNVAYRLGFADSRRQARQIVLHGHLTVGDRKTDIPSYSVRPGDVIEWKESRKDSEYAKLMSADLPKRPVPAWLDLDVANLKATVRRLPSDEELDTAIDTRLIVEYYSR